jgi:2-polyprenyl-3-methyl-5-hydroxy-6-metoxy-1,4-benzoquinol methylase
MHLIRVLPQHNTYEQASWLRCDSRNIGVAPQGFGTGRYDILFATNVLHATRDMAATLANCKALLRPGGLLLANELTAKTAFLTLTFGLTEGWWLYDDATLRIPGKN